MTTLHQPAIRRVVILGHSGFIGTHLCAALRRCHPAVELVGLSKADLDLIQPGAAQKLADWFTSSTALIICAGIKRQLGDNLGTLADNLTMIIRLAEVLERHPVRRVVFLSSSAVYGEENQNLEITEISPVLPNSYYGIGKHACESILVKAAAKNPGVSVVSLRPTLVYGPGDQSHGYGPCGFIDDVQHSREISLWGDGTEQRDFVFVNDLTEIVRRLTFHACHGVVNVATGTSHSYREIIDVIAQLHGAAPRVVSRPRTKLKVDHGFRIDRLRSLLPDIAFTSLENGIAQTLAAAQETAPAR